ncbi:MAG TPA: response regulator [Candidatus Sabulitectum sp.]|nr:response regulator [Candidatus Sabulitectum sp.]HPR22414.1 response regulator [Candidatus Sabulitectum sp.]
MKADRPPEDSWEVAPGESLELEWRIQHIQHLEGLKVLTGGIANDLNNLLLTIGGNVDMVMSGPGVNDEIAERLTRIRKAVRNASSLTYQMLSYIGRGDMVMETLNLKRIISETEKMMRLAPEKRAVLEFDLDEVPPVRGDVSQIIRLVINMIANSSEITCSGSGTIGISLRHQEEEGKVLIEVRDRGCGLDRDTLNTIFGSCFHTGDSGRGLGMADALELILNNLGSIEVDYPSRGEGSVTVSFPVAPDLDPQEDECGTDPGDSAGSVIMVVDDDPWVLDTVEEMLNSIGHRVLLASDGCQAVELVRNAAFSIDCAILDLNMPDLNGRQTFSILREMDPGLPVILSSGFIGAEDTRELMDIGIGGFLQKPFDIQGLSRVLNSLLKGNDNHEGT